VELGRVELVDLLVDGDGFEEEAVAAVVVGDLSEDLDRLVVAVDADPEVADAVQGVDVIGVVIEEALVLLDRRLDLALCAQLFRAGNAVIALNRHRLRLARTAASPRPRPRTTSGESGWGREASTLPDAPRLHTPDDDGSRRRGNGHDTTPSRDRDR